MTLEKTHVPECGCCECALERAALDLSSAEQELVQAWAALRQAEDRYSAAQAALAQARVVWNRLRQQAAALEPQRLA